MWKLDERAKCRLVLDYTLCLYWFVRVVTQLKVNDLVHTNQLYNVRKKISAAAASKSLQSCLTLCDPTDGSPPGSAIPGIFQARTLEWVAITFSKAWKWKVKVKLLSRARLLATPWTAAYQAPLSMGFSRQQYWSGLPLPSPKGNYKQGEKTTLRMGENNSIWNTDKGLISKI